MMRFLNGKSFSFCSLAIIAFLLVGCGTVTISQTLNRDGTSDIMFEAESDNEMFLNLFKEAFSEKSSEGFIYLETENGFSYSKEDVPFDPEDNFFGKSGFKREFRFPYYYYTLTIKNEESESDDSESSFSAGFGFYYVVNTFGVITDTNGIIKGEDKKTVEFNLMDAKKEYFVTFKDFFITSMLSGATKIPEREATATKLDDFEPEESVGNMFMPSFYLGAEDDQAGSQKYQDVLQKEVQSLEVKCLGSDNWDRDAQDDGITLNIMPLTADGSISPIEGTIDLELYRRIPKDDWGFNYAKGNQIGRLSNYYQLKGESRFDYFEDNFYELSYSLQLNWSDVPEFTGSETRGIVKVIFTPDHGEPYEAETGIDSFESCQLKEE